jgi:hypothetical protein
VKRTSKWKSRVFRVLKAPGNVERLMTSLEQVKLNQGKLLSRANLSLNSTSLQDYEFKVFSQWGEDGIIQKLISSVEIKSKTFIEFGVEDFTESNCRFLMTNNNWSGFIMDGSTANITKAKASQFYWAHELQAVQAFIDRDNVNDLLKLSGFGDDVGILSIDIDGIDYWVLEAIDQAFLPRILIVEYNAVFGCDRAISVPYDPHFNRTAYHHSNLYFGASLPAFAHLAAKRGYDLVGTNSAGGNAFFVRRDLMNGSLNALSAMEGYTRSKARESRDRDGRFTFLTGDDRLTAIRGLPVIDVIAKDLAPGGQIEPEKL